jgi:hypothetical protein
MEEVLVYLCQRSLLLVSSAMFCIAKHTKKNCRAIQNKRCGMLTSSVVLFHCNVCLHTPARTEALLEHFSWELFDHPSYGPDLTPMTTTCLPSLRSGWITALQQ